MGYLHYHYNKAKKSKEVSMADAMKKLAEMGQKDRSIKDRLTQAGKLAALQLDLRAQVDMPSKNALHSKYKNGIAAEIADIEQQKLDILRTVLAEGVDMMITVVHDGGERGEILLSQYVAQAQVAFNEHAGIKPEAVPTAPGQGQPKKVGKFFVYNGGKNDGTVH
jgi:hypothetical protein